MKFGGLVLGLTLVVLVAGSVLWGGPHGAKVEARLLVSNPLRNQILEFNEVHGTPVRVFIEDSRLNNPDDMTLDQSGQNLYICSGSTLEYGNLSSVLVYDALSGLFLQQFTKLNPLLDRCYGLAFDPFDQYLYVSSFGGNSILRFNATTGAFVDVFAQGGSGNAGDLNGPDDLVFRIDDEGNLLLYVTTDPSLFPEPQPPSQVLVYNVSDCDSFQQLPCSPSVFINPPPFPPTSTEFVSLLGLDRGSWMGQQTPASDGEGAFLYVSNFGGNITVYDIVSGDEVGILTSTFNSSIANYLGYIAFSASAPEVLYATTFEPNSQDPSNISGVLRFNTTSGKGYPIANQNSPIFVPPTPKLERSLGIFSLP